MWFEVEKLLPLTVAKIYNIAKNIEWWIKTCNLITCL